MKKLFLIASALLINFGVIAQDTTDCFLSVDFSYTIDDDNIYFTNTSSGEPLDPIYSWSIDGLTSALENPSFSTLGFEAYEEVCLTVYDSVEFCFGTYCEIIYLDGDTIVDSTDCLLEASFTFSLDGGMLNLFNTSTGELFDTYYNWSVDGLYSSEENPSFSTSDFEATEEICLTVYDSAEFCIDTYCLTLAFEDDSVIIVDSTAGIFSAEKVTMEMFPNPAKDALTIKVSSSNSNKQVNVYSAYGELVRVEQIARENSQVILDLTDLTNGIYIVTIIDEENPDLIIREKLIKN